DHDRRSQGRDLLCIFLCAFSGHPVAVPREKAGGTTESRPRGAALSWSGSETLFSPRVTALTLPVGGAVRITLAGASSFPLDCLVLASTACKGPLVGSALQISFFDNLGSVIVV